MGCLRTMANPWFRLYSEFSHDPKVQMMPEAMQRRYVMLMCLRCSNALETLHETEIAFHLRITAAELTETKALFVTKGFIDEGWQLLNWEKRQFASDSSTARVRKMREALKSGMKQSETFPQRSSNGPEQNRYRTDTDTDTDTEKKKKATTSRAPTEAELRLVYVAYPRKVGAMKAMEAIRKAVTHLGTGENRPVMSIPEALEFLQERAKRFAESVSGQQGEYTPHPATWFNQGRYLDDESEWDNVGQSKGGNNASNQRKRGTYDDRQQRIDEETRASYARLSGQMGSHAVADDGIGEARA